MKNMLALLLLATMFLTFSNCTSQNQVVESSVKPSTLTGQSGVKDDVSQKNIVQIALGSKDHTTLVAAVKAAELVDVLSNAGPFTVYAPTDAAFAKLPKATLDDLMKPENKDKLQDILEYHVSVAVFKKGNLRDGQTINQVNLKNIMIGKQGDALTVNGSAHVLASIPASNGIIHVIDEVLLPK